MTAWLDDLAALEVAHAHAQHVARAWIASDARRWVSDRFDTVPHGDAEAAAAVAEELLSTTDWIGELLAPLVGALGEDHLFEPPLRVHRDPLRTGVILLDLPAVSISATVTSADALADLPPPQSVVVPGRLAVVRYHRAEGAVLRRWKAAPVGQRFSAADEPPCRWAGEVPLANGVVLRCDGREYGTLLTGARRDLVTISATIRYAAAPLMREYALPAGGLLRTATLDEAASRTAMLLTLLRLGGRADAGAAFEAASHHSAFHLRWSAMREWLALDVAAALPRLRGMAVTDPDPDVRAAAHATLRLAEQRLAA